MYHDEPPLRLKAVDLDALDECPASGGGGSRLSTAALDRWKAVRYALEGALANGGDVDAAVEDNAAWLDRVQKGLVTEFVTNGVLILGASDAETEFDPEDSFVTVEHPSLNIEFASYFQIVVTDPRDPTKVEYLKIRTGREGTSASEAAILLTGGEPDVGYADLMLRDGTVEAMDMPRSEVEEAIARLNELAARDTNLRDRKPGRQCYRCDRVATCGQYPAPDGYRVGRRQRTIRVSKSDVLRLDQCHRRVAWKAIYAIPQDSEGEAGLAAVTGLLFHEILAEVLLSDDPDGTFSEMVGRVSPEDRDKMIGLYERHKQIESSHVPVRCGRTEYQVGATFILEGLDADRDGNVREGAAVAIAIIARTDAVGREPDNTPAVIEHRTGKTSDRIDDRETAMYALSTARLLGVDTVAVHQHALGTAGDPECIRIVYDADRLAEADELLMQVLAPIVAWDPVDATQPSYSVGEWCTGCPYQERCTNHRN
ncbi:MAG: PD-(D/E)XK nuclease family protein [Actinomycetota bacterium]